MRINAHAATEAGAPLTPLAYDPGELRPHEVEIEISHCGVCHSDIHLINNAWSNTTYPLVPGHEIVGRVARLGGAVAHLIAGQRVGVGWQRSACLTCDLCLRGCENLCPKQAATCVGHHGGFADRIRADSRFVFPIPDELDAASAAPLLCGGLTVFAPLIRYHVDATSTVGVIGIGGLGHMGILLLKAFGCSVTAFSSSAQKGSEARAMGADEVVSSTDARSIREHAGRFDLLLSTVHVRLDWITYLQALRPGGTLCFLGGFPGLLQVPPSVLLLEQKSVSASRIGNRSMMLELLRFAARRRISPQVQVLPMSEVNVALERLRANQARYRLVLER